MTPLTRTAARSGHWIKQNVQPEPFYCFVPNPLPPSNPALQCDNELLRLQEKATLAIGRLDTVSSFLPDPQLLLYSFVRKEAVLSSQIEGTQSSLSDLLVYENDEAPGVPASDVREVSNYVAAFDHGMSRLRGGFPLSLRLIREVHRVLLRGGRGGDKEPGEFRRSQNWVGGSRPGNAAFVPAPASEVLSCMGALEKFLHDEPPQMPTLIKAGLAHAQFETIHPFLDGNGRLGRLLITFILCAEGVLKEPLLYLSLYFKENRSAYYDRLQKVRTKGQWEEWLKFYLLGIEETAGRAVETSHRLLDLFKNHRQKIETLGKAASSALLVYETVQRRVVVSLSLLEKESGLKFPTVSKAVQSLVRMKILREMTGRKRNRLFSYDPFLRELNDDLPKDSR